MPKAEPLQENPSQTAGPYVHIGCTPNQAGIAGVYPEDLGVHRSSNAKVQHHELFLRIIDGADNAVTDAMVEVWVPDCGYWARSVFDKTQKAYLLQAPKPEQSIDENEQVTTPNISLWIVARGINLGLHTRMYFPDEDNEPDYLLGLIGDDRRGTLIAEATASGYKFDVHLQGAQETVFLDI